MASAPLPRSTADWWRFISGYSKVLLRVKAEQEAITGELSPLYEIGRHAYEVVPVDATGGWLGRTPASDTEVVRAEQRLELRLPASYRNFLLASNGLIGRGIPSWHTVLPVQHVARLAGAPGIGSIAERWNAALYGERIFAMLERALWITAPGHGDYWLLDPDDVAEDGEWRAWTFHAWRGAMPQPSASFAELCTRELLRVSHLLERRGTP